MTRDVFISHAGDDASVAVEVCALLEKRGLKCWMAPRDVDAGSVWDEAILDAIESSRVFLLILSKSANDSQFVKNEVNRAFSQRKPIVTFRLEEVTPGRSLELYLARHHWTDAFPPPLGARVERLASSITSLLNAAPANIGAASSTAASTNPSSGKVGGTATVPATSGTLGSRFSARRRAFAHGVRTFTQKPFAFGASMALLGILIGIAIWNWKPARLEAPKVVTRFAILPPPGTQLASLQNNLPESVAISPDGTRIAFTARQGASTQIYLRPIDTLESRPISGSEGGAVPFFSPDSQWVGFVVLPRNELMKAPVNGGPVVAIGTGQGNGILRWTSQETILFGGLFSPLHKIPATGGDAETIGAIEKGETGEFDPLLLPDGKNVVYVSDAGSGTGGTKIDIRSLATGERHDLIALSGTSPHYVAPGYLVYGTGGNLMAAPFDLKRLAVAGNTVPVIQGILQANAASDAHFDISGTGTLVYVPGAHSAALKMVWVDRKGVEQPVNAPAHNYVLPRISPDGQRVTAGIEEGDDQVWTYDFGRDTLTRVTFQGKGNLDPIWTPDGKRIVFKGTGNRLFWQPADGSGTMEELTNSPLGSNNVPGSWSPDGQNMAFTYDGGGGPRQIWILPLKDRKPFRLAVNSSSYETSPRFSPDGRWMAYTSTETGRSEVYVRPYPGPGGKWQISTDGGSEPVWNPKGRELFFRSGKKMMVVEYVGQQSFTAGKPKELFEGNYIPTPRTFPDYDITPDGQKFLMLKTAEDQQSNSQINVVVNWVEELKQKVPTGKK